jgi:hypothetical protein
MSARTYTFVTVVFEAEYDLLALQARSMRLYCPLELIDSIFIVENSQHPATPGKRSKIMAEYGHLSKFVKFLMASEIANIEGTEGWWGQQILKLMVAQTVRSERYLVLDAKSHLIFKLTREFLEAPDGRARIRGL